MCKCTCSKESERFAEVSVPKTDLMYHDFPGADPYAALMNMARLRAAKMFEHKYGRPPVWERSTLEIQNSEFRVSCMIRESVAAERYTSEVKYTPPPRGASDGRIASNLRSARTRTGEPIREVGSPPREASRGKATRAAARRAREGGA